MKITRLMRRAERWLPDAFVRRFYLRHLRFDERDVEGMTFELAETREDRESALRLVHDNYLRKGLIDRSPTGMHVSPHALLPTTTIFIAKHAGRVIGTLSLVEDSPLGVPSDDVFPRQIARVRERGGRLAELSAFAIDPNVRGRAVSLMLYNVMFRWVWWHRRTQDIVIAVHPRIARFYEVVLLFDRMRARASYHRLKEASAEALHLNLRNIWQRYERMYAARPTGDGAVNLVDFFGYAKLPQIILPPRPDGETRSAPPAWREEDVIHVARAHHEALARLTRRQRQSLITVHPALAAMLNPSLRTPRVVGALRAQ